MGSQAGFCLLAAALLLSGACARPVEVQTTLSMLDNPGVLTAEFALANPLLAFRAWVRHFGKDYADNEQAMADRLPVFTANAAKVAAHDAAAEGYSLKLNKFADLTWEEFAATHLGVNPLTGGSLRSRELTSKAPFSYADVKDVPSSVDWRAQGAVTPVKNQLACGSCWAFSTTGAIEGINAIKTGKLVSLSEQELVSCDREKDMGCSGGLMDYAFDYVAKNGGLDTEEDYAYWSFDMPCQRKKEEERHVVTIDGHEDVPVNDADALRKAVAHQPVSVAICASSSLQLYGGGVFPEKSCCTELNHGVLAVGYEAEPAAADGAEPHWVIKNSWGEEWGESGFFRLSMDAKSPEGACGVHKAASFPVKKGSTNPEVPELCGYFGWSECPARSTCVCNFSFFDLVCFSWGCDGKPEDARAAPAA